MGSVCTIIILIFFINETRPICPYFETISLIGKELPIANYEKPSINQIKFIILFTKIAYVFGTKYSLFPLNYPVIMPSYH